MSAYRDPKTGDTYAVAEGLGDTFMTFKNGSRHRVKSSLLPVRYTHLAAQLDLDSYAQLKGFEPVPADEEPRPFEDCDLPCSEECDRRTCTRDEAER